MTIYPFHEGKPPQTSSWSIAYCSRMTKFLTEAQLYELAAAASACNHRLGIRGLLLIRGRTFFQILEGSEGFVRYLYGRIALDTRHTSVTKVIDGPIDHPRFGDWHMRLVTPDDISPDERSIVGAALDAFERHGGFEPQTPILPDLKACSDALARGVYRNPPTTLVG